MRASTSLIPLTRQSARIPQTCCSIARRHASNAASDNINPALSEEDQKKAKQNEARLAMMKDEPSFTPSTIGVFANYITPLKRRRTRSPESWSGKVPGLKNTRTFDQVYADFSNRKINRQVDKDLCNDRRFGQYWVEDFSEAVRSAYLRLNTAIESGNLEALYSIASAEFQSEIAQRRRQSIQNHWRARWRLDAQGKTLKVAPHANSKFQRMVPYHALFSGIKVAVTDLEMEIHTLRAMPNPFDKKGLVVQALTRFRSKQELTVTNSANEIVFQEADDDVVEYIVFQKVTGNDDRWIAIKQLYEGDDADESEAVKAKARRAALEAERFAAEEARKAKEEEIQITSGNAVAAA